MTNALRAVLLVSMSAVGCSDAPLPPVDPIATTAFTSPAYASQNAGAMIFRKDFARRVIEVTGEVERIERTPWGSAVVSVKAALSTECHASRCTAALQLHDAVVVRGVIGDVDDTHPPVVLERCVVARMR